MENKQIHLLTFFNAINFGTYLQAYALQQKIKELGFESEFINLNENKDSKIKLIFDGLIKYKFNPITVFKKVNKLKKSNSAMTMLQISNKINSKNLYNYDFKKIIVGSDEVWNINNSNVKDIHNYFGYKLNYEKICSYAASFGSTNIISDIKLIGQLKKFEFISIRDLNSKKILDDLSINSVQSLDPTLIYDFQNELLEKKYTNYLLVYGEPIVSKNYIGEIKNYAILKSLKIISVGPSQKWTDLHISDASPFEFLTLIKFANKIVTNTFHGLILSLKYNVSVSSILLDHKKNKVVDIFKLFDIDTTIEKGLDCSIDWVKLNARMLELKNQSINHLTTILNS